MKLSDRLGQRHQRLTAIKNHDRKILQLIDRLTDKAADFYATWLSKAGHRQLMQFKDRHNVYIHLLAFVKHQYFTRQDFAIDILCTIVLYFSLPIIDSTAWRRSDQFVI